MFAPHPEPPLWAWLLLGAVEFAIRIVALGVVPKHRRASTSTAWLLLIFLWPFLGVPLYFIFGSWWAMGRRLDDDPEASALVEAILKDSAKPEPTAYETPDGSDDDTASLMRLTGSLSGFPDSCGHVVALHNETADTFRAMAASIDRATHHVNALYFQTSWDEYSAPFYEALERAKARGVTVRLLVDHHGMRTIPGHRRFRRRLDDMGILWHQMLPFAPLRGHIRRPDLRNHRKLLVVDGREAYIGSHNLVAPDYDTPSFQKAGIAYDDTSVSLTGRIVTQIEAGVLGAHARVHRESVLHPRRGSHDRADERRPIRRRGRALSFRAIRPVPGRPRTALLLRGIPQDGRAHPPVPQADYAALQVCDRRRQPVRDRLV